jgi:hypothetical protein
MLKPEMQIYPVVLFVYKRPEHTRKVLDALRSNLYSEQTDLIIYADGPKADATDTDLANINEVREIVQQQHWCKSIDIRTATTNKGLANSIIDGVSEVLKTNDAVIVLEDDILTSKYFLAFMNFNLNAYMPEKQVFSIGACNIYGITASRNAFFLNITDCWGWAVWKDRWAKFISDPLVLLKDIRQQSLSRFYFNAYTTNYFEPLLEKQVSATVDSWAIRWQASVALQKGLVLYPSPSLSIHLESLDGSSTHQSAGVQPDLMGREPVLKMISTRVRLRHMFSVYSFYIHGRGNRIIFFIKWLIRSLRLVIINK